MTFTVPLSFPTPFLLSESAQLEVTLVGISLLPHKRLEGAEAGYFLPLTSEAQEKPELVRLWGNHFFVKNRMLRTYFKMVTFLLLLLENMKELSSGLQLRTP